MKIRNISTRKLNRTEKASIKGAARDGCSTYLKTDVVSFGGVPELTSVCRCITGVSIVMVGVVPIPTYSYSEYPMSYCSSKYPMSYCS